MKYGKVIYYSDEKNDEFSGVLRNKKEIPDDYKYINRNFLWRICSFIAFRIVMTPVAWCYCKLKFHLKIKNKGVMKKYRKSGFFMYGNHTQVPGDGYIQALTAFPKRSYPLVNPDSVAIKGTEQFMLMIGALPLPSGIRGLKNLQNAINERLGQNRVITIYPEAHIWPYYTGIRPFGEISFTYPVKTNAPSFCFTVTYQKRSFSSKPVVTVWVDGPFLPDRSLPRREQPGELRDRIYAAMCTRSRESTYEYIRYVKKQ